MEEFLINLIGFSTCAIVIWLWIRQKIRKILRIVKQKSKVNYDELETLKMLSNTYRKQRENKK